MERRYFWLLDHKAQKNFIFIYTPGQENLADYPTKHHTAEVHQHVRPYYLQQANSPIQLIRAARPSARRGCVETLADGYLKKIPLPRVPSIAQAQAHTANVDLFRTRSTRTRTRVPVGHGTPVPLFTGTPIPHPHSCTSKILHRITHEMRQLANRIM